ncbi:MAG TPA: hypothetical protein VFS67_30680 [Polyangiaceae bacterium]|nr:hypothetical protein [Polyangiaceae bacterium]
MAERARRFYRPAPPPEQPSDELVLLLLGDEAGAHWSSPHAHATYNWRGAHIASWSVPVASCVRCRGPHVGGWGLQTRGTTHQQCFPEMYP